MDATPTRADPAGQAAILSRVFRRELFEYHKANRLKPREFYLALLLCRDSYDEGLLRAPCRLEEWAQYLKLVEGLKVRWTKCRNILFDLRELGIIDLDEAQGLFEIRPNSKNWGRVGRLHTSGHGQEQLKLGSDRPLSGALCEVEREAALNGLCADESSRSEHSSEVNASAHIGARGSTRPPGIPWDRLKTALSEGGDSPERLAAEFVADKSATGGTNCPPSVADKSATAKTPQNQALAAVADKSATGRGGIGGVKASLASVQKELASCTARVADKSATVDNLSTREDRSAEAFRWLQSVDTTGQLRSQEVEAQWFELCEAHACYALGKLRSLHQRRLSPGTVRLHGPLKNPLGWLAFKAIQDNKLRELRR